MDYGDLRNFNFSKIRGLKIDGHALQLEGIQYSYLTLLIKTFFYFLKQPISKPIFRGILKTLIGIFLKINTSISELISIFGGDFTYCQSRTSTCRCRITAVMAI